MISVNKREISNTVNEIRIKRFVDHTGELCEDVREGY